MKICRHNDRHSRATGLIFAMLAGSTIVTFLLARDSARRVESGSVAALGRVKELNAKIDTEVFSLHHGVTNDFDRLNRVLLEYQEALQWWREDLPVRKYLEIESPISLEEMAEQKEIEVEDFKSAHCVMRNSVTMFLRLSAILRRSIKTDSLDLLNDIANMESHGLSFISRPTDTAAIAFAESLECALESASTIEGSEQAVELLRRHGEVILSRAGMLDRGIETIWQLSPEQALATEYAQIQRWAERQQRRSGRFQFGLFLSSFLLLAFATFKSLQVQRLMRSMTRVNGLLERRVAQRSALLQRREASLRQKHKLEAIGCLAGGVAHEFNNMLQVIRGNTRFAMEDLELDSQPYRDLEGVLDATERAVGVTGQLLSFSRRQPAKKVICDVNRILDAVSGMFRPLCDGKIDWVVSPAISEMQLLADEDGITQAILNLCINARDSMPQGGRLHLAAQRRVISADLLDSLDRRLDGLTAGEYGLITVSDTGDGMSTEVQEHIFEPFFTTKPVGEGTGMGLSLVYSAAHEHHGTVMVESQLDQGSCFYLYLPLYSEDPNPRQADVVSTKITNDQESEGIYQCLKC